MVPRQLPKLVFALFLVVPNLTLAAEIDCSLKFAEDFYRSPTASDIRSKQAFWAPEHFSNPKNHSLSHFRYLVHAGPNVIDKKEGDGRSVSEIFFAAVKELRHQRSLFSVSLISDEKTATFSRSGIILRIPEEKIVAATSEDMRSHVGREKTPEEIAAKVEKLFSRFGLKTPEEILAKARPGIQSGFDLSWTEVIVNAQASSKSELLTTGIFFQSDSFGKPLVDEHDFGVLQAAAMDLKVPLVQIPPPKSIVGIRVKLHLGKLNERSGSGPFMVSDMGPKRVDFPISRAQLMDLIAQSKNRAEQVWALEAKSGGGSFRLDSLPLDGSWMERSGSSPKSITLLDFKAQGIDPVELKFSDH